MKNLLNKLKDFFKVKKHVIYAGIIGVVVLVLTLIIVITATASDAKRFEYELMEDGTYRVVDIKNTYRGGIFFRDDLVIPAEHKGKPVTTVDKIRSTHISKITLEEGITTIGNNAFSGLTALEEVNLPESLTTIKNNSFENCPKLKHLYIPSGVTSMGETIGCNNLDIVFYVSKTAQTGWNKNWNAMGFTEDKEGIFRPTYYNVTEGSYYTVGDYEYLVSDKNVTITNCFSPATEITIPEKVKINNVEYTVNNIGQYSFDNLKTLKNITIPTTVTKIGNNAFEGCSELLHTHFGKNIEEVGAEVFKNCSSVVAYIEKSEAEVSSWDPEWNVWAETEVSSLETEKEYRPVYYNVGADEFILIDGYECVFEENNELTIVYYRYSNENVEIPATLTNNGVTYSVVNIGNLGFANQKTIKNITLPSSIKTIGVGAFNNCIALERIYLSENITYVGRNAFTDCNELIIYSSKPENITNSWGKNWNSGRPTYFNVSSEDQIVLINEYFEYLITGTDTAVITKYRAPYKTMIASTNLKNVTINNFTYNNTTYKVTEVGALSFEGKLNALNSVVLGENVTKVGSKAFVGCTKVKTFTIGKNVTSISEDAIEATFASNIFFEGTQEQWMANNPYSTLEEETNAVKVGLSTVYFYLETEPTETQKPGNYWHFVDNVATVW